jgi:hypothetical protein
MDAKEISKKVRDYFYEVHGQFGVVGFRIENVLFEEKSNAWTVECSFLQSMMASEKERAHCRVIIDFQGKIKNVAKVSTDDETLSDQIKKLKESRKISR